MSDYLDDVKRYDSAPDERAVDRIVKHLGIALRSRDSSLVSCSDASELARVRDKWCVKKLGAPDAAAADAVIEKVCKEMKGDRSKSRVTFYYLCAKHLGKLASV